MDFTVNVLDEGGTSTDASSFSTASITPAGNALIIACVQNRHASPVTTVSSCTGCGITWTQHSTVPYNSIAAPSNRVSLFRVSAVSPTTGVVTFDFGGVTQLDCNFFVFEVIGADLTQGSQGVIQVMTDKQNSGAGDPDNITLAAFGNASNGTFSVVGVQGTASIGVDDTPVTYSPIMFGTFASASLRGEWLSQADTNPSFTVSVASSFGQIAIEVALDTGAAAVPGGAAMHHYAQLRGA